MKPCLFLLILVILHRECFSQNQTYPIKPKTRGEYLQKSQNQRIGGWVLLGAGIAGIAAVAPGNASFGTTGSVALLSAGAILGSIPLFLAAHRNKKRARHAEAFIEIEKSLNVLSEAYRKRNSFLRLSVN